ncbi:hypothetical protein NDU88_006987 [Pleurodeles waltl]|uniref:Uncharacterized protein n=1 Tax=Pleurodeles waltl TaxID=8319 RepID=A0AAV7LTF5_PLEWA|nr:hypothetical protein NDU88_006987 [Pleurodeles waltl]
MQRRLDPKNGILNKPAACGAVDRCPLELVHTEEVCLCLLYPVSVLGETGVPSPKAAGCDPLAQQRLHMDSAILQEALHSAL